MMLALLPLSWSMSCCSSMGSQPTTLASCDRFGINLGLGGDIESGAWSWDGQWAPVGDDGGGDVSLSVAGMGRISDHLQAGLQIPIALSVDSLDGQRSSTLGMGSGLLWLDMEIPSANHPKLPLMALNVGLGTLVDDTHDGGGSKVIQVAFKGLKIHGPWTGWGSVAQRWPILGVGIAETEVQLALDHRMGSKWRVGLAVDALSRAENLRTFNLSTGPTLMYQPDNLNRLLFSLRAGLPVDDLGRNTSSQAIATLSWFHVISRDTDS